MRRSRVASNERRDALSLFLPPPFLSVRFRRLSCYCLVTFLSSRTLTEHVRDPLGRRTESLLLPRDLLKNIPDYVAYITLKFRSLS